MFSVRHWKDNYSGAVRTPAATHAVSLRGLQQVCANTRPGQLPIQRPVQDHPLHGLQRCGKEVRLPFPECPWVLFLWSIPACQIDQLV